MVEKIKCPKCGHEVFMRISIEPITIEYNKEQNMLTDVDPDVKLVAQPHKGEEYETAYKCANCGRPLAESEMRLEHL